MHLFICHNPYPDKYDMLMDIATEELGHLEIVGATIQMLLAGVNGNLKDAAERNDVFGEGISKDDFIHSAFSVNPQFGVLTGGGPRLTDSNGVPWQGSYVNANSDLTVDLRSDIAAESRAKIVYEYLMQFTADKFVRPDTLLILALGLVAFVFDTAGGVLFAKLVNLFLPEGKKLNPMIGAAGISAFPMSGRVVNKLGLEEDNQNFLLMYSISVNVSGQIASVIAGGLLLTLLS